MIGSWIKKKLYLRKWRKINSHNLVEAVNFFDISKVTVGKYSYGGIYLLDFQTESKLNIGSFCSIAPNVMFCLGAEHRVDTISSFPFKVKVMGEEAEAISKGDIIVKDDVWLGYGSIIMSGVTIGQGAVIAAGSVVTKDVPPYAIVGGIPAEVIKYRFPDDIIQEMLKIDYNKLDEKIIREHIDELYQNVSTLNQLTWLPRKSNY